MSASHGDRPDPHAPRPGAEGLAEPLRSRWSPSLFDEHHVLDDGDVAALLAAVQWAPSFGNTQPWSYLVLARGAAEHDVLVEHLSRGNAGWVPRASVVLLSAVQVGTDPGGREVKDADFARYDVGQSAAYLTLQAAAMGLHVHQFAGYDRDAVAAALGVPDHVRLLAGIAVGRRVDAADLPGLSERERARDDRVRERRDLGAIAHRGRWGTPWPRPPQDDASGDPPRGGLTESSP